MQRAPKAAPSASRLTRARRSSVAPRREGTDERSDEVVRCLLTATARVITDVGWHELSTNRVAKVAGVGIGTLYRYFPNRESLGRGLVHKLWNDELAASLAAGNGGVPSPVELVRAYVRHVAKSPKLYSEWAKHLTSLVAEDAVGWDGMAIALACQAFDSEYEDHPRKQAVCEIIYISVLHVVRFAACYQPQRLGDGTIERELLTLLEAYLAPFTKRAAAASNVA